MLIDMEHTHSYYLWTVTVTIVHCFSATAIYVLKITNFYTPPALSLRMPLS